MTGRRGRIRKQILYVLKEKLGYWKPKEAALDSTVWRNGFGKDCGPVVRKNTE